MITKTLKHSAFILLLGLLTFEFTPSANARIPEGWRPGAKIKNYEVGIDTTITHSGKASGYITNKVPDPKGFGTLFQKIRSINYRGKRVRLTAYIKTKNVAKWASMWMRVDGLGNKQLSFDNMRNRPIKGTTDWTKYQIVLDVADESYNISFGLLLDGEGKIWGDDFQLEVVGRDVPSTAMITASRNLKQLPKEPVNTGFEK